jgi:hypothetical protein
MDERDFEFEQRALTKDEEFQLYGPRKKKIGYCCKHVDTSDNREAEHFYMQEHNRVLHVFKGELINSLPEGFFNSTKYKECDREDFDSAMRQTIFELEIYKYMKPVY